MTTKLFGICRYILTLRMAKQGYNALHAGRRRIHSNFYTCVVLFLCFAFICLVNPPFYLQFSCRFCKGITFWRIFHLYSIINLFHCVFISFNHRQSDVKVKQPNVFTGPRQPNSKNIRLLFLLKSTHNSLQIVVHYPHFVIL